MEERRTVKRNKKEEKNNIKNIFLYAMLLSGAVVLIISVISLIAGMILRDPLLIKAKGNLPHWALVKMVIYFLVSMFLLLYIPLKSGTQKEIISRKSGLLLVICLTYLFSSISLAFFLKFSTEMVDYDTFLAEKYPEGITMQIMKPKKDNNFSFNFRESFFDAVSGFTTTGLTAFRRTEFYVNGEEIPKIDLQPRLIHIIRATYLWVGGLGIMFFYLYFSPVPSLIVNIGYEISAERSLPKFIRLEGLSFSLVYVIITFIGMILLYYSISSVYSLEKIDEEDKMEILTYSVVLSFSSISTGGFSPESSSIDELGIVKYEIIETEQSNLSGEYLGIRRYHMINNRGLLVIMGLMLIGAMPLFSLHRPWKFFRRWQIFMIFLIPVVLYAIPSYSENPQRSLNRAFDAVSACTTTGLYTSQFVEDFNAFLDIDYVDRSSKDTVEDIYTYRFRSVYIIILMFVGGAAYSTAGGWGFFNILCIFHAFYLTLTGKLERVLVKYMRGLIVSFLIFFLIFSFGTYVCYRSSLFGKLSGPEPATVTDYVINSAFYEISALSTVGLMPSSMIQDRDIYYHGSAYGMLVISMLVGRLYYMIVPFIVSFIDSRRRT